MKTIQFEFKNKTVQVFMPESPIFPISAVFALCGDGMSDEAEKIIKLTDRNDFGIVSFIPVNWNDDYTPWPAKAVFKGSSFGGKAPETLNFIASLLPEISQKMDVKENVILGYSLGGLMALWSMYESDLFSACACCSGSLWYDGFLDYIIKKHPRPNSRIYLSLGKDEHKTKNPKMRLVGQRTSEIYEILKNDTNVSQTTYVLNEGGHFSKIPKRLSLGIKFMLEKNQ
ncbi:MAG: alpha/beta hydrolase-fold protein [Clostridia bacterium]|jgi:predicted alpha/beta superfamily hydrolase|nr:alpha/beta hydrolase-fold protein [Clostridia bacterium]MCI2000738.1 alpha/beta hydrolase-fold protein [Clostridia bacterium]MCI2015189.1 alpha/beta hydrolase-fold protein [Clostridia bacterium]